MSKLIEAKFSRAEVDEINIGQAKVEFIVSEKDFVRLVILNKDNHLEASPPYLVTKEDLYEVVLEILDEVEENMGDSLTDENKFKRELAKRISR